MAADHHRSDIGWRVAQRREQLGLSRGEAAERAGIAPQYLRYLEEGSSAPTTQSLSRVARALESTVAELTGVAPPEYPSARPPGRHRELEELGTAECSRLLAAHSVGRVSVSTPRGPAIVPVAYAVLDDEVVFGTEPEACPSFAAGSEVAFEVDQLDEALSVGWTVQVTGHARRVTGEDAVRRLAERVGDEPWERGEETVWVRVDTARISGRRVRLR